MEKKEPIKEIKKTIRVPYYWSAGYNTSRFFQEFKDNKVILGTRCTKCDSVLSPPARVCGRCFQETEGLFPVSDEGVVVSFAIIRLSFPGQHTPPPYAYAMIRLDGTNTIFTHTIGEVDFDKIKTGMRVKAVWEEKRIGHLLDIKYFKPI